uniref:Uncharacterized protein n=1 Tax=Ipomoea trifida TaxID=35884 RepID=Q6JJ59_IPOTF|nr:hypothetical protein [Ipomoea trifida]BAF36294.1 hypothetical protein [Ipomoea trifida]
MTGGQHVLYDCTCWSRDRAKDSYPPPLHVKMTCCQHALSYCTCWSRDRAEDSYPPPSTRQNDVLPACILIARVGHVIGRMTAIIHPLHVKMTCDQHALSDCTCWSRDRAEDSYPPPSTRQNDV